MKKFLTLLIAVPVLFASCMKEEKVTPEETAMSQGLNMYSIGRNDNAIVSIPAQIAIRMNTLLVECLDINDNKDIEHEDVKRTVDGKEINYKTKLFGNATLAIANENTPDEKITISYPSGYNYLLANDYMYYGVVEIATGGHLLSDFNEEDVRWYISSGSDKLKVGSSTVRTLTFSDYSISAHSGNTWNIEAGDLEYYIYSSESVAELVMSCTVKLSSAAAANANYAKMTTEPLTVTNVTSSGNPIGYPALNVVYRGTSLVYQPKCSQDAISSGTETVESPTLTAFNPESYPVSSVKVVWGWANESACTTSCTVTYGDYSKVYINSY